MSVLVLGAGAWGTALAVLAARAHPVQLWARDPAQRLAMSRERANSLYLPGVAFPPALSVLDVPAESLAPHVRAAGLVVLANPVSGLRPMLARLAVLAASSGPSDQSAGVAPVVWLCKGFEATTGLMPHEVQAEVAPQLRCGALSGPSFALEVARGLPAAVVAASRWAPVTEAMVGVFHGPSLRVYASDDLTGVEVGGAVKNVLAIATGLCDGLNLGANARAALITRGLAEMSRLGTALGARPDTFMGLSGLGDLVLTATGDLSRNRKVGQLLASGQSAADAVASLGHVAEGVLTARTVVERARTLGVDMPIASCVVDLLDGRLSPADAVRRLMQRESRAELAPD